MRNLKKILISAAVALLFPISAFATSFGGYAHIDSTTSQIYASETALGYGQPIASALAVNLKNTGQTTLYTVPAGKTLIITDIIMTVASINTLTVSPIVRIGKASNYNEWLALTTVPAVTLATQAVSLNTSGLLAIRQTFAAGDIIKLDVQTGATATTLTGNFYLFGYLI